jgi:hypothetical protein
VSASTARRWAREGAPAARREELRRAWARHERSRLAAATRARRREVLDGARVGREWSRYNIRPETIVYRPPEEGDTGGRVVAWERDGTEMRMFRTREATGPWRYFWSTAEIVAGFTPESFKDFYNIAASVTVEFEW